VSFDGPLAPGSDIFSPAALPGNPEPRHKKRQLPCSYPNPEYQREQKYREAERINRKRMKEHIKNLEQQVADQSEQLKEALQRSSKLEAQIAALIVPPLTPSHRSPALSCKKLLCQGIPSPTRAKPTHLLTLREGILLFSSVQSLYVAEL
jgi:hypothetical protein